MAQRRHAARRPAPARAARPRPLVRDRLAVRSRGPGIVHRQPDGEAAREEPVHPVGGVMAGSPRHQCTLGPVPAAGTLHFVFHCTHPHCDRTGRCCHAEPQSTEVSDHAP